MSETAVRKRPGISAGERSQLNIWLVRHASTEAGDRQRFQGRVNTPLSPHGLQEAQKLAERFQVIKLQLILSSDLERAWKTATIIGNHLGIEPVKTKLLRECSWGRLEGMTLSEAKKKHPGLFSFSAKKLHAGYCGGEWERRLLARSRKLLRILSSYADRFENVLVVGHARILNALFASSLGLKARDRWPFAPSPASLSLLRYNVSRRRYELIFFNDCCHLHPSGHPLP